MLVISLYVYIDKFVFAANGGSFSTTLKQANVPFIPTTSCNGADLYGDGVEDGMFCAGYIKGKRDVSLVCR